MITRFTLDIEPARLLSVFGIPDMATVPSPTPRDTALPVSKVVYDQTAWVVREQGGRLAFDVMVWRRCQDPLALPDAQRGDGRLLDPAHRCLVPASSVRTDDLDLGHRGYASVDHNPFAMPAVWWRDEGAGLGVFALLSGTDVLSVKDALTWLRSPTGSTAGIAEQSLTLCEREKNSMDHYIDQHFGPESEDDDEFENLSWAHRSGGLG